MSLTHQSSVGTYKAFHVSALQATAAPVGNNAATTATTAIAGGNAATTVTPVSMANLHVGDYINVFGGTGTAEYTQITAVTATTFTATFANAHSGTYNIVTRRATYLGSLLVNQAGSSITITLYDGFPGESPDTGASTIAVITPQAGGYLPYHVYAERGLFYTVAGTTAGDYTLTYLEALSS